MNRYFEKDYTFSKAEEVEQKEAYNRIVNKCRKKVFAKILSFWDVV